MDESIREPILVVASESELPATSRVWHCWWPPEQREALDWLTLTKLFGWDVSVTWQTNSDIDTSQLQVLHNNTIMSQKVNYHENGIGYIIICSYQKMTL